MSPVKIINSNYVSVPETAAPPPEPVKLTALEARWVVFPVLQHVLLYEGADMPPFDAILQSLRSSLAATLGSFAPLAGRLVHLEETGEVAISCSATDGVRFVVAVCDADIRRLAGDEEHDLRVLEGLVPEVDMSQLPTSVLAVQATRFEGGVAVGLTVHHGVADGLSLWTFVKAWATACRGETPAETPCFDRSLVKLPGGEDLARSVLRKFAPNLPLTAPPAWFEEERTRFTRRTFTLDAGHIQRLKQHIVRLGEASSLPRPPSTFAAVAAFAWTCFIRCRPFVSDEEEVLLIFLADVRDRLDPPVKAGYIGVCLWSCLAKLPAGELRGERALATAASAIRDEVRRMREVPVAAWDFQTSLLAGRPMDRLMNVSGSPRFRAYEDADFGWGRPRRTEPIRMNHDGQVALMGAGDGHGVQVSVSLLQPAEMDLFRSHFHELLG